MIPKAHSLLVLLALALVGGCADDSPEAEHTIRQTASVTVTNQNARLSITGLRFREDGANAEWSENPLLDTGWLPPGKKVKISAPCGVSCTIWIAFSDSTSVESKVPVEFSCVRTNELALGK